MAFRLADYVQVRKESWGLLFYHQKRHKIFFVRSGDWLGPEHFDGTWTALTLNCDVSRRRQLAPQIIAKQLDTLMARLADAKLVLP